MFSGLGSISDLNQQFAQFTSNLTNLDSLQDGTTTNQTSSNGKVESNDEGPGRDGRKSDALQALEAENAELREELQVERSLGMDLKAYLSVKDDQLQLKETEVTELRDIIRGMELSETNSAKELAEYKVDCERRIRLLTDSVSDYQHREEELQKRLEYLSSQRTTTKSDDSEPSNDAIDHEALLAESQEAHQAAQRTIADLTRRLDQSASDLSQATKIEADLRAEANFKKNEIDALNTLVEGLQVQLRQASESVAAASHASSSELDEKAAAIERLEADVQGYLNSIVQLNEERDASLERCAAAESRSASLEERLRSVQDSATQQSASASGALDELSQAKELAEDRARLVRDAEGKVGALTEKLKDMMHRFAELKSKSTTHAQQLEERVAEITKLAQAKDSEILGLRLKMENSERSGSDMKLKVGELAERYGEAQRELTRLRDGAEERRLEIAALTEERDRHATALSVCEAARDELVRTLKLAEEHAPTQIAVHESRVQDLEAKLARRNEEFAEQLAQLRAEVDAAHSRLRAEEDSAGNLDNYKKRAQLALKKANSANATLTAEVQQLQAALEEISARLADAQETNNATTANLLHMTSTVESIRMERDALEEALTDTQAKFAEMKEASEREIEELKALRTTRTAGDHDLDSNRLVDRDICGAISTTTVPVVPALSLAPAGAATTGSAPPHLEDSRGEDASPSADSELAVYSADYSSSPRENNIRGSSWAMVAASGSRTTSTHPSTTSMSEEAAGRPAAPALHPDPTLGVPDDRVDFKTALSSDSLLFISQLQSQLDSVRKELSRRGIDLEAVHQQLQYEKEEKRVLKNRVEELMAFLERTKQLHEGPDSAINMEYLKNCTFKFMSSSDLSEKRRLYPVIATILKLTGQEMKAIELAFQVTEERDNEFQNTLSSIGNFATSSIGSFWGSATGSS